MGEILKFERKPGKKATDKHYITRCFIEGRNGSSAFTISSGNHLTVTLDRYAVVPIEILLDDTERERFLAELAKFESQIEK